VFQGLLIQLGLALLLLPIIIPILLAILGAQRIRERRPTLLRKYIAVVVILGVVLPPTFVIVITLSPPRNVELDIAVTYKSNSTSHEYSVLYHWDASSAFRDSYGIHLNWRNIYAECTSNDTGTFAETMETYTHYTYIEWTEITAYSNATWTLRINFVYPVHWTLLFGGDNITVEGVQPIITDGRPISGGFPEALEAYGIEGLTVYAGVSLGISAGTLQSFYTLNSTAVNVPSPVEFHSNNVYMGIIPHNP
jgi:hypothetical protein